MSLTRGTFYVHNNNSIIGKASNIKNTGYYDITINEITYKTHVIVHKGDLILDGKNDVEGAILNQNIYEFGDKQTDVATKDENAKNMVILKVEGNLIIEEGVSLTACKSDEGYGGPKGMLIYCEEKMTNKGTISMTQRGAIAEGEDVYLWKNKEGTYEYVPSEGAIGGEEIVVVRSLRSEYWHIGSNGNDAQSRQTRWRRNRSNNIMGI